MKMFNIITLVMFGAGLVAHIAGNPTLGSILWSFLAGQAAAEAFYGLLENK